MPQTSVTTTPAALKLGQIATLWGMADGATISRTSEEASAGIPFGVAVKEGTNLAEGCLKLTANTDRLVGIVTCEGAYAIPQQISDTDLIQPGTTMNLMFMGPVVVQVEGTVNPDSEVHVRAVAAGNEVAGAFRAAKDGTDTIDCSAFCRWLSSSSGGMAVLWVDMSKVSLAVADS